MRKKLWILSIVGLALFCASGAQAGPVFLTGHDPDFHAQDDAGAQHLMRAGINFVRHGSPLKFLWVESRIPVPGGHRVGRLGLTTSGYVEGVDFEQKDGSQLAAMTAADWANLANKYSAIAVASDFGGILTQAELDQLIAHKTDIEFFINQGGGVLALAESGQAGGLTTHDRFGFLPIAIASTGNASPPYAVTSFGTTFGLGFVDVNSPSHSHFDGDFGLNVVTFSTATGQNMTLAGQVGIFSCGFLTANAGPDQTLDGGFGATVILDGSGSNVANSACKPLIYAWSEGNTELSPDSTNPTASVHLAPGVHTITLTVTDNRGESVTDTVVITIRSTAPPTISCPASQIANNEPGLCSAHVTFPAPIAIPAGSAIVSTTCDAVSGSAFSGGTDTVHCTTVDTNGNSASCSFGITVRDVEPPVVIAPPAVTSSADATCSTSIPALIPGAVIADNCTPLDELVISQSPAADTVVTLGSYPITISATDESGNTGTGMTSMTVVDTKAPVFDPATLAPQTVAGRCDGAPVNLTPPRALDCQSVSVACTPISGTSLGANSSTCTATDADGRQTTATITVNVLAPLQIRIEPTLWDDNDPDDVETDADSTNLFIVGDTIKNKVTLHSCACQDVTSSIADNLTVRLTVRYRDDAAPSSSTSIAPTSTSVGGPNGALILKDGYLEYDQTTSALTYPSGSWGNSHYFQNILSVTYNTAPSVVVGQEDVRLESE